MSVPWRLILIAALVTLGVGCGRTDGNERGTNADSAATSASTSASPSTSTPATSSAANDGDVVLQDYAFGGDFTLDDASTNRAFKLSDVRGKVALLFFGYTSCPDACPLTMSKITRAVETTPGAREQVVTLFITVDVDRDGPETLARYVKSFGVPMVGLRGTRAEIDAVVAQYRAVYRIEPSDSAGGPSVSHSVCTYLIDQRGQLRYLFRHDDSAEKIAKGLAQVLHP